MIMDARVGGYRWSWSSVGAVSGEVQPPDALIGRARRAREAISMADPDGGGAGGGNLSLGGAMLEYYMYLLDTSAVRTCIP